MLTPRQEKVIGLYKEIKVLEQKLDKVYDKYYQLFDRLTEEELPEVVKRTP